MKPATELTDAELASEHDAASYFANASENRETVQRANARLSEIEKEWDRRAGEALAAAPTLGEHDGQ